MSERHLDLPASRLNALSFSMRVLICLVVSAAGLSAEPFELKKTPDRIVLLPFESESGEEALLYLEGGIPESMAAVFAEAGFAAGDSESSFSIDPHGAVRPSRGKVRIYLDVRIQKWNEDLFRMRTRGDLTGIARRLGARYLVTGSFRADPEEDITQPRKVHLRASLFDASTGRTFALPVESDLKSILRDAAPAAQELRKNIELPRRYTVKFEGEQDVMVYLDEQYLGRSPLASELPAGRYKMRLEKDGRISRVQDLEVTGSALIGVGLEEKKGACSLAVKSTPAGADVYLNVTPIGKTPLERSDLPCGTHRVRVSSADHVDRFTGVILRKDEPASVELALVPGDTVKTFRDPGYVVLDFTYADLSFYSFINALGFYGGYAYFDSRARTIENNAKRQVPLLAFYQIQSMTLYHALILEQNRLDAKLVQQRSKASGMAGGLMLGASIWFLYKSFEGDYRETGEVGAFLTQRPELSGSRTGTRWDAGYQIRF